MKLEWAISTRMMREIQTRIPKWYAGRWATKCPPALWPCREVRQTAQIWPLTLVSWHGFSQTLAPYRDGLEPNGAASKGWQCEDQRDSCKGDWYRIWDMKHEELPGARDHVSHAEASENAPYPWNPPLRRTFRRFWKARDAWLTNWLKWYSILIVLTAIKV